MLHRQADTNSGDRGYFKLLQTIYSDGRRWRHSFRNRLQPVAGNHNRRVRHIHLYREGNLTDGIGPGKILTVFREGGKSRYRRKEKQYQSGSSKQTRRKVPVHKFISSLSFVLHVIRENSLRR